MSETQHDADGFARRPAPSTADPPRDAAHAASPPTAAEQRLLSALSQIESHLKEIRASVDVQSRDRRHVEFSPAITVGIFVQAIVVIFLVWALADWVIGVTGSGVFIKLEFAAVLQLIAATTIISGSLRRQ